MAKHLVEIYHKLLNDDGSQITLKYSGQSKNEVNEEKYKKKVVDFLQNNHHMSIVRIIDGIKGILSSFKEVKLEYTYEDIDEHQHVLYENGKLIHYESEEKAQDTFFANDFGFEYNPGKKLTFTIGDHGQTKAESENYINIQTKVNYSLCLIEQMKAITPNVLSDDDRVLAKMYSLFFNDEADFSSDDINDKVNAMVYILSRFGIALVDDMKIGEDNMPNSDTLNNVIDRLYPVGVIQAGNNTILTELESRKIKTIGKQVMDSLKTSDNKVRDLVLFSQILSKYNHINTVDAICKDLDQPLVKVVSSLNVFRTINSTLNKKRQD